MSKNYTNYNKPQEAKKQNEVAVTPEDNEQTSTPVVDVTSLDQTDATANPTAPVTSEDEQTSNPEPEPEAEPIIGVVSNCKMLNVRAAADKKADIITIFNAGTEVEIIEEGSTDDFYHIYYVTSEDVNVFGYCMKEFITIK